MKLKDRVAIVSGGSQGIGLGIATVFCQQGAKVVVASRDPEVGEQAAASIRKTGGEAVFVTCDVSEEAQVKAMAQKTLDTFGRIDVLVNNAGIGVYKTVLG